MEALTLQLRRDEETIECWDDDGDLQCTDDIHFRTASSATSVTNSSIRRSGHRDSISSRRSARSDLESNAGGDEDWQVLLHESEDIVTEETIASAKNAGIPIPANVPKSALIGGTIKRLGRRKPKKDFVDDWSEDVELPGPETALELKTPEDKYFPEALRQISSVATSPVKTSASPFRDEDISTRLQSALTTLDKFREDEEELDIEDVPTIKVAKSRSQQKNSLATSLGPPKVEPDVESFDNDFDLPYDNLPLQLPAHKHNPRTSSPTPDDFDLDWSEGSIGIRFAGTARDRRSDPGSSVSVASPSVSSCLTGESEDDGLDGLIIPDGPLDLETALQKRQKAEPKETAAHSKDVFEDLPGTDDFFSGIEIENGDVFIAGKLSLNPNIKRKTERPGSPARRSATSITFTNTTVSPKTRIPRLSGHDRPRSTHLETVSESGAPLSKFRRPNSRLGGHASHSSISSCPPPGLPVSPPTPSTPSRRLLGARFSKDSLTGESVSSDTHILKPKRSMPAIRNAHPIGSIPLFQRSPPRPDTTTRPLSSSSRPRTPVDCTGTDVRSLTRRSPVPFIPAGASENQSHHVRVKTYRHSRRTNSDGSGDMLLQGSIPRMSRFSRSEPIGNSSYDSSPEALVTAAKRTLTKPTRRRNFGDGTELESFDDLPTSASAESKFVKHPTGRGAPRSFRSRMSQSQTVPPRTETPIQPTTPVSATKALDITPRFARDTNASRNAREQRIASMTMTLKNRESNPLVSLGSNWKAQTISKGPSNSTSIRSKKGKSGVTKPQLIKPIGTGVQEAKSVKGMRYNPARCVWEGNENCVSEFDTASTKSPRPAPALITNVGAMQNVQVVGGMVFDPQRMCWLKLAPMQPGNNEMVAIQDDDDVFAGLDDLQDKVPKMGSITGGRSSGAFDDFGPVASGDDRSAGESSDEWPMTEEFDVGPEFIKRQRAEEEKWRRKVNKWVNIDRRRLGDGWRWAIRDLVQFHGTVGSQQFSSP